MLENEMVWEGLFGVNGTSAFTDMALLLAIFALFAAGGVAVARVALYGAVSVAGGTLHSGEVFRCGELECGERDRG